MVLIHPSSVLEHRPEWVLYQEYVLTSKNYIRTVLDVKPEWFFDIAPEYFNPADLPECEAKRSLMRVVKRKAMKPAAKTQKEEGSDNEPADD